MDRKILGLSIVAVIAGVLFIAGLEGYFKQDLKQEVPLPDIAGEFFTTIVTDNGPESQRLQSYFDSNPQLNKIQQRERHNQLASTDPYYLENFKPRLKEAESFPIFLIQRPNGDSCLLLSKDTLPNSSEELLGHIRRRCTPKPVTPEPDTPSKPPVKERPLVDTIKKVVANTGGGDGNLIAFIISSLLSGGYGLTQILQKFSTTNL